MQFDSFDKMRAAMVPACELIKVIKMSDDPHDKVIIHLTECNGCHASEAFLNYLSDDDKRINNEH